MARHRLGNGRDESGLLDGEDGDEPVDAPIEEGWVGDSTLLTPSCATAHQRTAFA